MAAVLVLTKQHISIINFLEPVWAECLLSSTYPKVCHIKSLQAHIFCGQHGAIFMFHIRSFGLLLVTICEKKLAILGSTFKKLLAVAGSNIRNHTDSLAFWCACLFKYT